LATVVRTFAKGAAETGRGKGRMRANYGAAMKAKTSGLEQAAKNYNTGLITAQDYAREQMVFAEQALGTVAGGLNSIGEGMNVLVGLSDKQMGAMKLMSGSMQMTRAMMAIYRVWGAARRARAAKLMAIAAGETTAAIAAQQYHRVALALGATAMLGGLFGGGYYLGKEIAGGTVDLGTHSGQRQAMYKMRGAV